MARAKSFAVALLVAIAVPIHLQSQAAPPSELKHVQPQGNVVPRLSIIDNIEKTIVFIEADCKEAQADGKESVKSFSGTAFLLSVADPRIAPYGFTYLVTNRHVAQPGIEFGQPCNPFRYLLRTDLKEALPSGSFADIEALPPNKLQWTFPSDDSVDLAIAPLQLLTNKLDIKFVPSTLLMSDEQVKSNRVEEGDSVLFSGLFVQLVGQTHSEHIIREGKIAMIPREPVPTTLHRRGDLFLVDCHVFGGNSGSPMFINLAGQRESGLIPGYNYRLLGVVSGYISETSDLTLQTVASYAGTVASNSGIATVVPAQKVLDLLDAPELKAKRDAATAAYVKQKGIITAK